MAGYYLVIKNIYGNRYYYYQLTWRGSKVKTLNKYVGPVDKVSRSRNTRHNTILDPCVGTTGTTGVACALLNRTFVGIKRDLEYYNMARERIANAHEGVV
jgi:site-specific DNA-methyltransferase (adenine-specific)